jgi:hypothetical protein
MGNHPILQQRHEIALRQIVSDEKCGLENDPFTKTFMAYQRSNGPPPPPPQTPAPAYRAREDSATAWSNAVGRALTRSDNSWRRNSEPLPERSHPRATQFMTTVPQNAT